MAFQTINTFAHCAFHRITCMLWHSHSWPGRAASMRSEHMEGDELDETDDPVFDACVYSLRLDYRIYLDCTQQAARSGMTFIQKLVSKSVFKLRFVAELAIIVSLPIKGLTSFQWRRQIRKYINYVFFVLGGRPRSVKTSLRNFVSEKTWTLSTVFGQLPLRMQPPGYRTSQKTRD